MAFDRGAVAAGGAEGVPIAPVDRHVDGVARTRDDGPALRRSGDDVHALARHCSHVVIDVDGDGLGREGDHSVPGAAAQPAIDVGARPSPLRVIVTVGLRHSRTIASADGRRQLSPARHVSRGFATGRSFARARTALKSRSFALRAQSLP